MTRLPVVSDTITIRRDVFDPVTKHTAVTDLYTGVPAFIHDLGRRGQLEANVVPEYSAKIIVDDLVDLQDGDQITGYNPLGLAVAPFVQVNHVSTGAAPGMGQLFPGVRTGYLKVSEHAG